MKMRLKMRRKFAGFWFWWEPSRGVGQWALLRQSMPCNLISNCFFLESPWSSQPNCGPPSWQNTNNSPGEEKVCWSSWWSLSQCLTSSPPWAPPSRRLATRWSRRRSPRPSDNTCRTATEHTPVSTAELILPTTTNSSANPSKAARAVPTCSTPWSTSAAARQRSECCWQVGASTSSLGPVLTVFTCRTPRRGWHLLWLLQDNSRLEVRTRFRVQSEVQGGEVHHRAGSHDKGKRLGERVLKTGLFR